MVKRTASAGDDEPTQSTFEKPSEGEHLLQVVDIFDNFYERNKFNLDASTIIAKLEVVGGKEEGRSLLTWSNIDSSAKNFWSTRLILKAVGEEYKGDNFVIDTDKWIGKRFYATVAHSTSDDGKKTYANIETYNYDKKPVEGESQGEEVKGWDE